MSGPGNISEPGRTKSETSKASGLMRRANSYVERGMYEEAIASIKEAMAICPHEVRFSLELASIYRAQNRMGAAVEAMQQAIDLDPLNSNVQEQLLQTLIEMGRLDEAIATSNKLLEYYPRNVFARDVLGMAYVQQGEIDKALQVTNELIRLVPGDPAHHFKKAVLLQQKGQIAQSMSSFIRALELDPEGELADEAREAIAALDSYQLRQVLTIALEDVVFRTKLMLDPEQASRERGFLLSHSGIAALRQIEVDTLPAEADNRYYH